MPRSSSRLSTKATTAKGNRDAISRDRILRFAGHCTPPRKWAATVSGTKISGYGSTRDEAIDNAEKAIERAIQKQRFKQDLGGEDQ
jgi:hypothetical protein